MSKLAFDRLKRLLDLGPDARFKLFGLVDHGVGFVFTVHSALRLQESMATC